jgi:hypothetical protein
MPGKIWIFILMLSLHKSISEIGNFFTSDFRVQELRSEIFFAFHVFSYVETNIRSNIKVRLVWISFCLNSICGIIDQSTTMSSIDMLYAKIFYKFKQFGSQSPATGKSLYLRFDGYNFCLVGLLFPAFIEAFFLLSQRKYSTSCTLLDSVTELINSCMGHLNLCVEESA